MKSDVICGVIVIVLLIGMVFILNKPRPTMPTETTPDACISPLPQNNPNSNLDDKLENLSKEIAQLRKDTNKLRKDVDAVNKDRAEELHIYELKNPKYNDAFRP